MLSQTYPGEYEVIFAVEEPDDPAVAVIERAIGEHPAARGRLVLSGTRGIAATGKLRNLIAGYDESRGEVVVFADSDVRAPPTCLAAAADTLADPEVGLAFAAPVCAGARRGGGAA